MWRNATSNTSSPLSKSTALLPLTGKEISTPASTFNGTTKNVPSASPWKGTSNHSSKSMNIFCPLNLSTLLTNTVKSPTAPNSNSSPTPKPPLHYIFPASAGSKTFLVHSSTKGERATTSSYSHSARSALNRQAQQKPQPQPSTNCWTMSPHTPKTASPTEPATWASQPTLMPHASMYPKRAAALEHTSSSPRRSPNQGTMALFSPSSK